MRPPPIGPPGPKEKASGECTSHGDLKTEAASELFANKIARFAKAKQDAVCFREWMTHEGRHHPAWSKMGPDAPRVKDRIDERMKCCGSHLLFGHYYRQDAYRLLAANFCEKYTLCAFCAIRRASRSLQSAMKRWKTIDGRTPGLTPYLVTLTVRSSKNSELPERFQHLMEAKRKLMKQRTRALGGGKHRSSIGCAAGGIWSVEVKRGKGGGWHPHVHGLLLVDGSICQDDLSAEWSRITGDSFVVDVRPLRATEDGSYVKSMCEVFKYPLKFADMGFDDRLHAAIDLWGRRLISSFGCFRGVDLDPELADEPMDNEPYVELLYRYAFGAYELARRRNVEIVERANKRQYSKQARTECAMAPPGLQGERSHHGAHEVWKGASEGTARVIPSPPALRPDGNPWTWPCDKRGFPL